MNIFSFLSSYVGRCAKVLDNKAKQIVSYAYIMHDKDFIPMM